MIFDSNLGSVSEAGLSPYKLGIEGGLMHVYENECNFNALMRAVGISELKYYNDTGRDLFVHEAGAFAGFIEKAKAFFKKVIEKIKQIFNSFAAAIAKYTKEDKEFVSTYKKKFDNNSFKKFDFKGYTFDGLSSVDIKSADIDAHSKTTTQLDKIFKKDNTEYDFEDNEAKETEKKKNRGTVAAAINAASAGEELDTSEFAEAIKKTLYGNNGEKDDIEITDVNGYFTIISSAKSDITKANNTRQEITKNIESFIKELDDLKKDLPAVNSAISGRKKRAEDDAAAEEGKPLAYKKGDWINDDGEYKRAEFGDGKTGVDNSIATKRIANAIELKKSLSNDYTTLFSAIVGAYRDRNRQAKAICVKALSQIGKTESYNYYGESSINDLFAGVTIR